MKYYKLFSSASLLLMPLAVFADGFIVVGKDSKVFDEPNAKGYVTLNQKDEEVSVLPGMVFKHHERANGWYVVEYFPGLRGYMSEQAKAAGCVSPKAGEYSVSNNPSQKITITNSNGKWTAIAGDGSYSGICEDNVVVFYDSKKNIAYSLVDLGDGPVIMSYDNSVTKFF